MIVRDKLHELKDKGRQYLQLIFTISKHFRGFSGPQGKLMSPVILQLSKSSVEYIGLEMAVAMARRGLDDFKVEGWLHLDHGDSIDLVKRCLQAGFDSVMIDASETVLKIMWKSLHRQLNWLKNMGQMLKQSWGMLPNSDKSRLTRHLHNQKKPGVL